jgi:DNA polymerase III delta prime subunit
MFFIDKYIPNTDNLNFFHKETYQFLKNISNDESIPHIIFHGMDGIGKKTMIKIFLRYLFGSDVDDVKQVKYIVSGSGNKTNEEYFIESNYHIDIIPKGNNNDRYLIQDVVKKYASSTNYNVFNSRHKFKVIVIHNIQNMLSSVQFSLRRTIEKYSDTCRFIIMTNSISKIIKPLISRCKCVKLTYPSNEKIIKYSLTIASKESINMTLDRLSYILKNSTNLKEILWTLQIYKNNDIYLEYINSQLNELVEEYNKLGETDIEEYANNKMKELTKHVMHLDFLHKNINRYINNFGTDLFEILNNKIKTLVDPNNYKTYFSTCKKFIKNYNKDTCKNIKFITENKKNKLDENILNIKYIYLKIFNCIKLFDINTDKNLIMNLLVKTILKADTTYFDEIRNIFFNLIITNFTGTEILTGILTRILQNDKICEKAKVDIIKICNEGEFNMIKGRREINQFDMVIINIIDILTKRYY